MNRILDIFSSDQSVSQSVFLFGKIVQFLYVSVLGLGLGVECVSVCVDFIM